MKNIIRIDPVDPFSHGRLYGEEKYSLQKMLLAQVNFPSHFLRDEDKYLSLWSDRVDNWRAAWDASFSAGDRPSGDSFHGVSPQSLLRFGQELAGTSIQVTGVAIIRYTNVSSGYPTLMVLLVQQGLTERPMGIPITKSKYGEFYDPYGEYARKYRKEPRDKRF